MRQEDGRGGKLAPVHTHLYGRACARVYTAELWIRPNGAGRSCQTHVGRPHSRVILAICTRRHAMRDSLSRRTAGLPGLVAAALILTWAVGFFLFRTPRYWFVLLVVGGVLALAQTVRRVNTPDEPD